MNVASIEHVRLQTQTVHQLVEQEINQQLDMIPDEITQSLNREQATLEVLKLLSPIMMQKDWNNDCVNPQLSKILNVLVADATSLALIRLVCHTAIALPAIQQQS